MVSNTGSSTTIDVAEAAANLVLRLAQEAADRGDTAKADALLEAAYALFDERYRLLAAANGPSLPFSRKWPFQF
jgi:hypothetical protein